MRASWLCIGAIICIGCKSPSKLVGEAIKRDPTILNPKAVTIDTTIVTDSRSIVLSVPNTPNRTFYSSDGKLTVSGTVTDSTIEINAHLVPDTIRVYKTEYIPQVVYAPEKFNWWRVAFIALFVIQVIQTSGRLFANKP